MTEEKIDQRSHPLQPSWTGSSHQDRFDAIRPLVEGRSVLDIGAGSGNWRADWFHLLIRSVSDDVVGIELSPEYVAAAKDRGVELVLGDAQKIRLDRTFDVVFAGELIEHLSCFSGLLDTAVSPPRAWWRTRPHNTERVRDQQLRLSRRRSATGERRAHVLVL